MPESTTPTSAKQERAHNFSAGPGTLPLPVLEEVKEELPLYKDVGASILEISHRSEAYDHVEQSARTRIKKLLGLSDEWHVLFLQGGASMQFHQVPLNFLGQGRKAGYVNTGRWSAKAIHEGRIVGDVTEVASSEPDNYRYIPPRENWQISEDAAYLHITTNNTVNGTQFQETPESPVPLVADASSDFMSRPIDKIDQYGLIYAGAQKNVGPAGVTIVLIRDDFLAKRRDDLPTMLDYGTHAKRRFNTPPVFAIYIVEKVMRWLESKGGVEGIQELNEKKAKLFYDRIDKTDFYTGTVDPEARSKMNVTFRLPTEKLEERFLKQAGEQNLQRLKGHRSVGGIRASMYNACPLESVRALISFMDDFERRNG